MIFTHSELVDIAEKWLFKRCGFAFKELTTINQETPDAIGFRSGESILVECKTSRSDFHADKKNITPESLLAYIISYRLHNEFHEECCERILYDLLNILSPQKLALICKYTRRGGIDINPLRIYPRDLTLAELPENFTQLNYTRDFHQ